MAKPTFGLGSLVAAASIGFLVGGLYVSQRANKDETYQSLAAIAEALDVVQSNHVSPPDRQTLIEDAIAGMAYNLDEYSVYLDAETLRSLEQTTEGFFVGIGVEVGPSPKGVEIISVMPNGPAERAEMKPGDIISSVDGRSIIGLPTDASISMIRGEEGTDVALEVFRGDQILPFVLTRAKVDLETISSKLLQGNVGWVRVYEFREETTSMLSDAIVELRKQAGGELEGLILDLRGNPGGLLGEAVLMSDLFIDSGTLLSVRGIDESKGQTWQAKARDTVYRGPMVTLVDRSSASAAELVAGSLQDNNRSLIVGQTSFGKGSVQAIIPLRLGGALKVTTSHYLTPSGRCVHREGIKPDVVVYDSRDESTNPHTAPRDSEIDAIMAGDDQHERERIGCVDPKLPPRGAVYHLDVAAIREAYIAMIDDKQDPEVSAALSVLAGEMGTTIPGPPPTVQSNAEEATP